MTQTLNPDSVTPGSLTSDEIAAVAAETTGLQRFAAADLAAGIVGAEELAEAYRRNGALQITGLLDADEIATVAQSFTTVMATGAEGRDVDGLPEDDPLKAWPRMIQPHREDADHGRLARRWMLAERVMGRVRDVVGPVWAAQSMFYFKPPGARGQAMHQDNLFLQSHPETCVAAWIAVDDCGIENGALAVVPGTHRFDIVCPEKADITESFTDKMVTVPAGLTPVQTEMAAGDCLIFHGSLVHGSQPNTTADRFRRSLIFHYIPEGSREVAGGYQPLLDADGAEVRIEQSELGGLCGDGWAPLANH